MGFFAGIAALCTPIALVVFWIFATRGRRNHPKWEILRRFRYAHRGLHDPAQGVPENTKPQLLGIDSDKSYQSLALHNHPCFLLQ